MPVALLWSGYGWFVRDHFTVPELVGSMLFWVLYCGIWGALSWFRVKRSVRRLEAEAIRHMNRTFR